MTRPPRSAQSTYARPWLYDLTHQSLLDGVDWYREISTGRHVLELGAGTGRLTRHLVEVAAHVVAVDVEPAMTAVLRRRVPRAEVRVADLHTLSPSDVAGVDLVLAPQRLLNHLGDLRTLARFAGCDLAFDAYVDHPELQDIDEAEATSTLVHPATAAVWQHTEVTRVGTTIRNAESWTHGDRRWTARTELHLHERAALEEELRAMGWRVTTAAELPWSLRGYCSSVPGTPQTVVPFSSNLTSGTNSDTQVSCLMRRVSKLPRT
jgi:SAM-dependent methyltransferase